VCVKEGWACTRVRARGRVRRSERQRNTQEQKSERKRLTVQGNLLQTKLIGRGGEEVT